MALCRDDLYIVSLESDQHQHQHGFDQHKANAGWVVLTVQTKVTIK